MRARDERLAHALAAHLELVWRVLRRSGLAERDVDEAAQDVFWILARRFEQVPERAERAFLVSTALRVASDRRRAAARRPEVELDPDFPSTDLPSDELVALRRARVLLDEALDALTAEQRAVFMLVELEEMTAPEAARTLGIPLGTVASRLRAARQSFDAEIRRLRKRERRIQP